MIHELKTIKKYWIDIGTLKKNFEVRKNDRNYQVGDVLLLRMLDGKGKETNKIIRREVTYILKGGKFGIESGYVVMGIR